MEAAFVDDCEALRLRVAAVEKATNRRRSSGS
jgi:hypothetical protein